MNTNHDTISIIFPLGYLASVTLPLMIIYYATMTPELYYVLPLYSAGCYTFLVLDEFRVPCRL